MTQEPPLRQPPTSDPEQAGIPAPREDEPEPAATEEDRAASTEAPDGEGRDPYDDLWDPDMDTRPVRIRRTKARPRGESRSRGGAPPRGK